MGTIPRSPFCLGLAQAAVTPPRSPPLPGAEPLRGSLGGHCHPCGTLQPAAALGARTPRARRGTDARHHTLPAPQLSAQRPPTLPPGFGVLTAPPLVLSTWDPHSESSSFPDHHLQSDSGNIRTAQATAASRRDPAPPGSLEGAGFRTAVASRAHHTPSAGNLGHFRKAPSWASRPRPTPLLLLSPSVPTASAGAVLCSPQPCPRPSTSTEAPPTSHLDRAPGPPHPPEAACLPQVPFPRVGR